MTEVYFYHSNNFPLERTLAKLVEKIYDLKQNIVIYCQDNNLVQILDDLLWSYSTKTFIPHATSADPLPEKQPVYITASEENPNSSSILIAICNTIPEFYKNFDKYISIFNNDDEELSAARSRYKILQDKDYKIKYFKQTSEGKWESHTK